MTRFRLYVLLLTALLVLYAVAEYYRPKPTDWTRSFINRDKIPFGTFALVDLLPDIFGPDVKVTREPIFNQLDEAGSAEALQQLLQNAAADSATTDEDPTTHPVALDGDTSPDRNYLFVNDDMQLDTLDLRALLFFAARGNHVFIAAQQLPASLLNKLHLRAVVHFNQPFGLKDSTAVQLVAGPLRGRRFRFAAAEALVYLRQDTAIATSARTLATRADGRAVLVRAPFGYGDFTICTVPIAFTNYHVLRPATTDFAFAALAQLPQGPVWWDEYQKQGREGEDSLFRVLYRHEALKLAFYLALIGSGLLLWIGGRRRQRIIPVVKPLPNNTLQFVGTVASLYRQGDNHALIAHRKIDLFLEFLRNRYQEQTDDLTDDGFRQRLAQKSGFPRSDIDVMLRQLADWRASDWVGDNELLHLSAMLNEFRRK